MVVFEYIPFLALTGKNDTSMSALAMYMYLYIFIVVCEYILISPSKYQLITLGLENMVSSYLKIPLGTVNLLKRIFTKSVCELLKSFTMPISVPIT